jgi:hypothetical protein
MFQSEKKKYIFAHLLLLLDWNLMKRSETCVNLKNQNSIWFDNDALVIEFAKSKGHQGGKENVGPWHVYANPLKPWKYPVLSLGRYLLTFSDLIKSNGSLFGGRSQYERYSKLFLKLIDEHDDELCQLGIERRFGNSQLQERHGNNGCFWINSESSNSFIVYPCWMGDGWSKGEIHWIEYPIGLRFHLQCTTKNQFSVGVQATKILSAYVVLFGTEFRRTYDIISRNYFHILIDWGHN